MPIWQATWMMILDRRLGAFMRSRLVHWVTILAFFALAQVGLPGIAFGDSRRWYELFEDAQRELTKKKGGSCERAINLLERAIREEPVSARKKPTLRTYSINYNPYFWLGLAKARCGLVSEAERMLEISRDDAVTSGEEINSLRAVIAKTLPSLLPRTAEKTKPVMAEPAKTEAAKTEAAKTEAAKTEAAKTEAAKTENAKTENAKTEAAKTVIVRAGTAVDVAASPNQEPRDQATEQSAPPQVPLPEVPPTVQGTAPAKATKALVVAAVAPLESERAIRLRFGSSLEVFCESCSYDSAKASLVFLDGRELPLPGGSLFLHLPGSEMKVSPRLSQTLDEEIVRLDLLIEAARSEIEQVDEQLAKAPLPHFIALLLFRSKSPGAPLKKVAVKRFEELVNSKSVEHQTELAQILLSLSEAQP